MLITNTTEKDKESPPTKPRSCRHQDFLSTRNALDEPTALRNTRFAPRLPPYLPPNSNDFIPPPHLTDLNIPTSLSYRGALEQLGYIHPSYLIDPWHSYLKNPRELVPDIHASDRHAVPPTITQTRDPRIHPPSIRERSHGFYYSRPTNPGSVSLANGDTDSSSGMDTSSDFATPERELRGRQRSERMAVAMDPIHRPTAPMGRAVPYNRAHLDFSSYGSSHREGENSVRFDPFAGDHSLSDYIRGDSVQTIDTQSDNPSYDTSISVNDDLDSLEGEAHRSGPMDTNGPPSSSAYSYQNSEHGR